LLLAANFALLHAGREREPFALLHAGREREPRGRKETKRREARQSNCKFSLCTATASFWIETTAGVPRIPRRIRGVSSCDPVGFDTILAVPGTEPLTPATDEVSWAMIRPEPRR